MCIMARRILNVALDVDEGWDDPPLVSTLTSQLLHQRWCNAITVLTLALAHTPQQPNKVFGVDATVGCPRFLLLQQSQDKVLLKKRMRVWMSAIHMTPQAWSTTTCEKTQSNPTVTTYKECEHCGEVWQSGDAQ